MAGKTLLDKIWESHTVRTEEGGRSVLYIDRHYVHEVTSPVAFANLKARGLKVARPLQVTATADHSIPTLHQELPIKDAQRRLQVESLAQNCAYNGITFFGMQHPNQGIVHIIGPEQGFTRPGMTIVCGDSHTATHGAFGAVAFGVGTSEVEMVLASQCLIQSKPKSMRITIEGTLAPMVTAKDLILYVIAQISASGGVGHFIEFAGSTIRSLSMDGRMTVCNMAIECGARGGMVAPDAVTAAYLNEDVAQWKDLHSDPDAVFDKEYIFDASKIEPYVTYGTNPGAGIPIGAKVPEDCAYMQFHKGEAMIGKKIDYVFVGSCTNGRIEDFRLFAKLVKGRKKAADIVAWIVPGSKRVERLLHEEGLDKIIEEAGFTLRQPGCSACLAMNEDKIPAGKLCVSTSNRNFVGRQGPNSRTVLASIPVAAAAAIYGTIEDPRELFTL